MLSLQTSTLASSHPCYVCCGHVEHRIARKDYNSLQSGTESSLTDTGACRIKQTVLHD